MQKERFLSKTFICHPKYGATTRFSGLAKCAFCEIIKLALIENMLFFATFIVLLPSNKVLHVTFDDLQVAHFVQNQTWFK